MKWIIKLYTVEYAMAAKTAMGVLIFFILIHILALFKLIPHDTIMGSRVGSDRELYFFETSAMLMNIIMLFLVAHHYLYLRLLPKTLVRIFLFMMTFYFAINTIGNLLARNWIETLVFTPLSLLLTLALFRMSIEKIKRIKI